MKGYMVVIEGVNGGGKGMVIEGLEAHFAQQGRDVVLSKEPGATRFGLRLRKMILDNEYPELFNESKLLLFAAARAQNLREVILPALQADKLILCDRWATSSVSFQGYAEGLPIEVVKAANQVALGPFQPDIVFILDIDPQIGIERTRARNAEADVFEQKPIDYHRRARSGYLIQAQEDPERFVVIDASQPPEVVLAQIIAILEVRMKAAQQDRNLLSA
ncbi:dTMP kinase [Pseudomonas sp. S1(2024)]|uniref:dTMP kinase n=1 Tax=Pseudomonas sp. S1(2024) TaxID=3390191 RepID=UPI003977E89B